MAVVAVLKGGMIVPLKPDSGATPRDVVDALLSDTGGLLGSAAPPDVWLEGADGTMIRYSDVSRLEIQTPN